MKLLHAIYKLNNGKKILSTLPVDMIIDYSTSITIGWRSSKV